MEKYDQIMIKSKGRIIFDPLPLMGSNEMFKPFWAIVIISGDIGSYYRFLFEKNYGLNTWLSVKDDDVKYINNYSGIRLQRPAWGSHISLIRGEAFTVNYNSIIKGTKEYFKEIKPKKVTDELYHYLYSNNYINQEDIDRWFKFKNKWDKKTIEFEYELTPKTVTNKSAHWWFRVKADKLKDIRQEMGYEREGFWGLHLTLGSPTPKCMDYSKLLSNYKEHGK